MLVNAESIRKSLGDFSRDKQKPAKMAARMARKHANPRKCSVDLTSIHPLQRHSLQLTQVLTW